MSNRKEESVIIKVLAPDLITWLARNAKIERVWRRIVTAVETSNVWTDTEAGTNV
jgi:hypothetical protein